MSTFQKEVESRYDDMTEAQKKVAHYVIRHYEQVAFFTLEDLAEEIGVSTTTVIRFARSLGYNGYSDLLSHIQQIIKMKMDLPQRLEEFDTSIDGDSLLVQTFERDIENLNKTLNSLDPHKTNMFVKELLDAHTIYVLGLRSSFSIAFYCAAVLGQVRENVRLVHFEGDMAPEEIIGATAGDVCLTFSFSRYTQRTVDIAKWLHEQKVKILAVSDQALSPIADIADLIITCEVKGMVFKNSVVAPITLVNYFVAALAAADKTKALQTLSKNDGLLKEGKYFAI